MRLNFLCTHHRGWLEQNPSAALSTCITSYERGLDLMEENDFRSAANHAGCALEAAQILISSGSQHGESAIGHYSDAGVLLVYSLMHLGEFKLAGNVHGSVLSHLENLLQRCASNTDAVSACQRWLRLSDEIGIYPKLTPDNPVYGMAARVH